MIAIELVYRFHWSAELGEKLRLIRDASKISRQALVDKISSQDLPESSALGHLKPEGFSTKYIERLEKAEVDSISQVSLIAIAKALGVGPEELLPKEGIIKIFSQEDA